MRVNLGPCKIVPTVDLLIFPLDFKYNENVLDIIVAYV